MNKKNRFLALAGVCALLSLLVVVLSCNEKAAERQTPTRTEEKVTVYPHPGDFMTTHGQAFLKNSNQCRQCHGSDLSGGRSKVACQMCHGTSFPHPSQWGKASAHGESFAKANESDRAACLNCHIPSAEKPQKAVSCLDCHKAYPHDVPPNQKIKKGMHGKIAPTFEGKCLNCHVDYKKYMSEDGCKSCHSGTLEIIWKDAHHSLKNGLRLPSNFSTPQKK